MAKWSLRILAPLAAVGCAGLLTKAVVGRRRARRALMPFDPPDDHLAEAMMEPLATGEGMPESSA